MSQNDIPIQIKRLLTEAVLKYIKKRKKSPKKVFLRLFPKYEKQKIPENLYNKDIDYMTYPVLDAMIKYLNAEIRIKLVDKNILLQMEEKKVQKAKKIFDKEALDTK